MVNSVIYFHGLESPQGGIKVDFLKQEADFVEAPAMDYTKEGVFEEWLDYAKTEEPDLIVGSSMGGYFAIALATHTGIPVLVFNPAVHSRKLEIKGLGSGTKKAKGIVVLGMNDKVINPIDTKKMLDGDWNDLIIFPRFGLEHRVPLDTFIDMYHKTIDRIKDGKF
jgi:hypothetical protein